MSTYLMSAACSASTRVSACSMPGRSETVVNSAWVIDAIYRKAAGGRIREPPQCRFAHLLMEAAVRCRLIRALVLIVLVVPAAASAQDRSPARLAVDLSGGYAAFLD